MAAADHWPFFRLRVTTPRLELRGVDDDLAAALGERALLGIHDPATMPFLVPWTDAPAGELVRNTLLFAWRSRAEMSPASWHLPLAVVVDGEVAGGASLRATAFAATRSFETGSWLGRAFQGRGLGRELREACLHLGFEGLGATEAVTEAFDDNAASLAVTRSLPYEHNGEATLPRRDGAGRVLQFRMPRAAWERCRRDDIALAGVEACLPLLGLEGGA